MSALDVRDLTVEYAAARGRTFRAVDAVSFTLHAGRTLALVGESGSGKSSVLKALSRLVRPAGGSIVLDGRERVRAAEYRRAVQMVFQDPFASLNPQHSVDHHLRRPLLATGRARRGAQADAAVAELLRQVSLTPAADIARKRPHELSGGQRQRVAIARALAPRPSVLLADEPVSMLDVSIRLEILNLLDGLKRDRDLALLYVTHDLATARHFSAEIMVMYRGQVVERGPSDQVILNPGHPYTQVLAAAAPRTGSTREQVREARRLRRSARAGHGGPDGLGGHEAERREGAAGGGCRFRLRCPHAMDVCTRRPPEAVLTPATAGAPAHQALCWLHAEQPDGRRPPDPPHPQDPPEGQ